MQKIEADVRLAFPTNNKNPERCVSIVMTDCASSLTLIAFELTAEQFTSLLASAGATVEAEVPEVQHYRNVGREYVVKKVSIPDDRFKWEREVTTDMNSFAVNEMIAAGFTEYRWTRHNYGWGLIISTYTDKKED